jgi:hypothetical protein
VASIGEENAGCAPALERNAGMNITVAIGLSAISVALIAAALFL